MLNLNLLNPEQRSAVLAVDGPLMILAGAGTGKTRVITHRIAHLVECGIPPDNVLAVTFSRKAAREMRDRVATLLPRRRDQSRALRTDLPVIGTFHSLCVRVLRQYIDRLGYRTTFVIYDEGEQLGAIKRILSQISVTDEKVDPYALLGLLSRYRNGGETAVALADPRSAALIELISVRYTAALQACNAVDFDDLILLTLKLFTEHPVALEECRARFRYLMVDEYQDTNAAQFTLVRLLASGHRNLCVVGDDDQSIYGWRGAAIANLLDFEKYFPGVKVIKLEQNYRSTNIILAASNALIKNNVRRRSKRLWSQKGSGTKILLHAFSDDDAEARTVVEGIEYDRLAHRVPWSEHAVLFRTNAQSRPLETAFRQAGVRYHLIGGQSFFDRREVRDFLAYLKVFLNPHDDVSLLRIANVPARGLSEATMQSLLAASQPGHRSVFATMCDPAVQCRLAAKARGSLAAFIRFIDSTRLDVVRPATGPEPFSLRSWADAFLDESGYLQEIRRLEKDAETAESRSRNLRELIATLDRRSDSAPLIQGALSARDQLQVFLDELSLDGNREEGEETAGDAVTLITIHSCKGLEFTHVHIVGLEDGLMPHSRSKLEGTLDEERRLFYVAMTRARQTLALSHCAGRRKYGQIVPCQPSPFLKELPEELLELAEVKAAKLVPVAAGKGLFANIRASLGEKAAS